MLVWGCALWFGVKHAIKDEDHLCIAMLAHSGKAFSLSSLQSPHTQSKAHKDTYYKNIYEIKWKATCEADFISLHKCDSLCCSTVKNTCSQVRRDNV